MSEEKKTIELTEEDLNKVSGGKVYKEPQTKSYSYLNPEDSCVMCSSCGACEYYYNHVCTWGKA